MALAMALAKGGQTMALWPIGRQTIALPAYQQDNTRRFYGFPFVQLNYYALGFLFAILWFLWAFFREPRLNLLP